MKQFVFVFAVVVLFAVAVIPFTVSAAALCKADCTVEYAPTAVPSVPACQCGSDTAKLTSDQNPSCYNGTLYSTTALCNSAKTSSSSGGLEKGLDKLNLPVRKTFPTSGPDSIEAFIPIINRIGNYIFTFFMVAALILIVMSALQFITGGGDPKAVGEARQKMLWAFVGIGFALLAAFFDNIVATFLNISPK